MRILVINPNATAAMTDAIAAGVRAALGPAAIVIARTNEDGPPAIEGPEDGAAAVPGLLVRVREGVPEGVDAVILACFDDTGILEARDVTRLPVIGIGEASFIAASILAPRFSVVTTLAVSVPVIEENLDMTGFAGRCARVRASGVAVLELEHDRERATARIAAEVDRAVAEDGVGAVVLGCAGMTSIAGRIAVGRPVAIVDPVRSAALVARLAVEATRHPGVAS